MASTRSLPRKSADSQTGPTMSNVFASPLHGAVSSMCWYASYREGRMSVDMEPSTTMKFLVPLDLTPVTVLTRAQEVATMERPGSMMMVRPCWMRMSAGRGRAGARAGKYISPAVTTWSWFVEIHAESDALLAAPARYVIAPPAWLIDM